MINEIKKRIANVLRVNKVRAYQKCFTDDVGNVTLEGKRVLKDLARYCSIDTSTACYTSNNSIDPIRMAYEEGKRTVLLRILESINISETEIQKMVKNVDGDSDVDYDSTY